jgi:quercetin dioxygenase-like cupin family protein
VIESGKLKLKLLAPKGLIEQGISVSTGESQKGKVVSKHTHRGFELTYIIKGKHLFRYGSEEHELNGGDLIYFDGRTPHSVTALEPIQFISVYFRDKA